jgi:hypothetical protein
MRPNHWESSADDAFSIGHAKLSTVQYLMTYLHGMLHETLKNGSERSHSENSPTLKEIIKVTVIKRLQGPPDARQGLADQM